MIGEECLKLAVLLGRGNKCWSAKKKDDFFFFTQRCQPNIIYLKNDNEYENTVNKYYKHPNQSMCQELYHS